MKSTYSLTEDALRKLEITPIVGGRDERREILQDFGVALIEDITRHNRNVRKMAVALMVLVVGLLILVGWMSTYLPVWSR